MMKLFFLLFSFSLIAKPLHIELSSPYALLMNGKTGEVLFEKQGLSSFYPASTTKIATALFVLEEKKIPCNQHFTVSSDSLKMRAKEDPSFPNWWWDKEGTRMWLVPGEKLELESLLHGLLVVSGDDAANVIAEGTCGSVPQFMDELNLYLKKIGCQNTHFLNPHGCHLPEHKSCAYDLCLIMKHAIENETIRKISTTTTYMRPKTNMQKSSPMKNAVRLLDKEHRFYYPKTIAVKTGTHSKAGFALVAAAEDESRVLIGAVMGAKTNQDRYLDMIKLFETAFQEKMEYRSFFGENHLFSTNVEGCKTKLMATLDEDLAISYFPSEEPTCKAFVSWKIEHLPVEKGDFVGVVSIVDQEGQVIKQGNLFAKEKLTSTFFCRMKDMFQNLFN